MKKFLLNVKIPEHNNAGNKARDDVNLFLTERRGFSLIDILLPTTKIDKIKLMKKIKEKLAKLNTGDALLINYPTSLGFLLDQFILQTLEKRKVISIALIHDIDSLRYKYSKIKWYKQVKGETRFLNRFNYVISSNEIMTKKLQSNGLRITNVINLNIFDYYSNKNQKLNNSNIKMKNIINFAGNLDKSTFINKLYPKDEIEYNLFGTLKNKNNLNMGIIYRGAFSPIEIVDQINDGFGLVWDGTEINRISGNLGIYLRYNNPHKASLYLAAGIPIIVWDQAAIASFVKKYKIGLTVSSLDGIDRIIKEVSPKEYTELLANCEKISQKIKSGFFIRSAIDKILFLENKNDFK